MAERTVRANGIEIWAEAGGQGILWPDEFCAALVAAGFQTIRYDNRDTGQSTCVEFAKAPYTLSDMARDVAREQSISRELARQPGERSLR